jgi:hypothetical protein
VADPIARLPGRTFRAPNTTESVRGTRCPTPSSTAPELGYQEEGEDLPEMEVNDGMPSSVAVILRLSVVSSWASLSLTPL